MGAQLEIASGYRVCVWRVQGTGLGWRCTFGSHQQAEMIQTLVLDKSIRMEVEIDIEKGSKTAHVNSYAFSVSKKPF